MTERENMKHLDETATPEVAALLAERDRLVRELVFLRTGDVIGGSTERDELMHAVTTDRQEILRLRADLEQTLGVVHRLKAELDEARARIDDLESSTSWRITAPLRRMVAYRNRSGGH